ncbi:MAG: hypothetical protein J6D16_05540 [Clostridia bacterium]|nr:hypothetical protein [Clostridia bacterium]
MLVILESFFVQIMFVFGVVILCGLFISFCNKCLYDACGDAAFGLVRFTGYIGTPVHELSHALMCILFGHTVTKIKLVNSDKRSRTLGYVEHTYYKTNLYHQIGNYFIGVAPILAGGAVVLLFVWFFVPDMLSDMTGAVRGLAEIDSVPGRLAEVWHILFDKANFLNIRYWLALVFSVTVVIHMEISQSDFRSGLRGLSVLAVMLAVTDLILGFLFPTALTVFTGACVRIGVGCLMFLLLPSVVSAIVGLFSLAILALRAMFGKRARAAATSHHRANGRKKPRSK